jgi:phospholipase/lecithinase/hemolysin
MMAKPSPATTDTRPIINGIIIMGDSLTDRGAMDERLPGFLTKLNKSPLGRFTNGYAWSDRVAAMIAADMTIDNLKKKGMSSTEISDMMLSGDKKFAKEFESHFYSLKDHGKIEYKGQTFIRTYAEGGMTADKYKFGLGKDMGGKVARLAISNLGAKRKQLLKDDKTSRITAEEKSKKLIIEWSGANDLVTANTRPSKENADRAIAARIENMKELYRNGYRNFNLFNLPNLGNTPRFMRKDDAERKNASDVTEYFNERLVEEVSKIAKDPEFSDINASVFDADAQFKKVLDNPELYGFDKDKITSSYTEGKLYKKENEVVKAQADLNVAKIDKNKAKTNLRDSKQNLTVMIKKGASKKHIKKAKKRVSKMKKEKNEKSLEYKKVKKVFDKKEGVLLDFNISELETQKATLTDTTFKNAAKAVESATMSFNQAQDAYKQDPSLETKEILDKQTVNLQTKKGELKDAEQKIMKVDDKINMLNKVKTLQGKYDTQKSEARKLRKEYGASKALDKKGTLSKETIEKGTLSKETIEKGRKYEAAKKAANETKNELAPLKEMHTKIQSHQADGLMFYDDVHPTAKIHTLISEEFYKEHNKKYNVQIEKNEITAKKAYQRLTAQHDSLYKAKNHHSKSVLKFTSIMNYYENKVLENSALSEEQKYQKLLNKAFQLANKDKKGLGYKSIKKLGWDKSSELISIKSAQQEVKKIDSKKGLENAEIALKDAGSKLKMAKKELMKNDTPENKQAVKKSQDSYDRFKTLRDYAKVKANSSAKKGAMLDNLAAVAKKSKNLQRKHTSSRRLKAFDKAKSQFQMLKGEYLQAKKEKHAFKLGDKKDSTTEAKKPMTHEQALERFKQFKAKSSSAANDSSIAALDLATPSMRK